jgi:CheY-like chemotaxis protein
MKSPSENEPASVQKNLIAATPAKILVVDDDNEMRQSLVSTLKSANYEVVEASNGTDAITRANEHLPDLVISDYQMPGLNGYMLLGVLRSTPHLSAIPFILITGAVEEADHRQSMNIGADDYLAKPFSISELLTTLKTRLAKASAVKENSERKLMNVSPRKIFQSTSGRNILPG